MRSYRDWSFLRLFSLLLLSLFISSCGGGGGGGTTSPAISSIQISPGSLLLTEDSQNALLEAHAYDAKGNEIESSFTWFSSNPSVISVDEDGLITRNSGSGSATITAQSDSIISNTAVILAAIPAADAIQVNDDQVIGNFTLVDPDVPWGPGVQYTVTLTGITVPEIGAVLVGTGEQPIGGRVVSASTDGSSVQVTLEVVGLDELFDELVINESMDLSNEGFYVDEKIAQYYEVSEGTNNDLIFTRNTTPLSQAIPRSFQVDGTSLLNPEANLGPFTCEWTTPTNPLLLDALPNALSISKDLSVILDYDSHDPEKLKRFGIDGKLEAEFKLAATLTAALENKVECKAKVVEIPIPFGGPVSVVFGGFVPIGLGFEVGGKAQLAQVGFELKAKAETHAQVVIQPNTSGDWRPTATAENKSSSDFKWIAPTMPVDWVTAYSNLRLEPTLMGFGFADLELGLKWKISGLIQKYTGIPAYLRIKALTAKGGIKQSGNFAIVEGQIADSDYKSKYSLDLEFTAGVGQTIDELAKFLQITILKDVIKLTDTIATSPTPAKLLADVGTYEQGDPVKFTLTLEGFNTTYPIIGYNVEDVLIYRKPDPTSGSNEATLIATLPASSGQTTFSTLWTADKTGIVSGNFFAFVKTKALPFDSFDELELGAIDSPGGAWLILGQDNPFSVASYGYVLIETSYTSYEDEYLFLSTPLWDNNCDGCYIQVIGDLVDWCAGTGGISETPYSANVTLSSGIPELAGNTGTWQTKISKFNGGKTATIDFSGQSTTTNVGVGEVSVSSGMGYWGEFPVSIYVVNDASVDIPLVVSWSITGETNSPAAMSYSPGGWGDAILFYQLYHFDDSCLPYVYPGEPTTAFSAFIGTDGQLSSSGEETIYIPPGKIRVELGPSIHVDTSSGDSETPYTTTIEGWIKFTAP